MAKLPAREKEKIGVVLSDSGFSGYLTVKDVVCIMKGMYKNFKKEEFLERCKQFGLPQDKQIKEFSTGMKAKLKVTSDCEDTCFYVRLSLCKSEGDYGLRDDINQISNFKTDYQPNEELEMDFSFDEHAFVIHKGEKIRIDISSSAFPHYVPHTNRRGLYSGQTTARIATNTVDLDKSHLELPIFTELSF